MPKLTIQLAEVKSEGKPITDFRVGDYVRCVFSEVGCEGSVYLVGHEKALNIENGLYVSTVRSFEERYKKLDVEEVILKLRS